MVGKRDFKTEILFNSYDIGTYLNINIYILINLQENANSNGYGENIHCKTICEVKIGNI